MGRSPRFGVIFLLAALTMSLACTDGQTPDETSSPEGAESSNGSALVGWAIAGEPLVGAKIEAVDADGEVFATSPDETLDTGTWYMPLEDPPDSFTLVASGGTDGGADFEGELKALVENYDHDAPEAIHINPATTLVADYIEDNPDASHEEATVVVKKFLAVPKVHDLASDLRVNENHFSGTAFMDEAEQAGGVSDLIDGLAEELSAGKKHAFAPPPTNQGISLLEDVIDVDSAFKVLNQANTALSIVGTIVGLIRGGQQPDALAQIATELHQLEADFSQLDGQVEQILKDVEHQSYDSAISSKTNNLVTRLAVTYPLYQLMVQSSGGSSDHIENAVDNFMKSIVTPNGKNYLSLWQGGSDGGGLDGIYSDLVRAGGQTGGLQAWSNLLGTKSVRFVSLATQKTAAQAISYWTNLQTQVLTVNAAYADAINNPPSPTPAPSPTLDMGTSEDTSKFGGDNVDAVKSQCQASGGPTSTDNFLLNEFNASHSCVVPLAQSNQGGPPWDFWVDNSTGLMWMFNMNEADLPGRPYVACCSGYDLDTNSPSQGGFPSAANPGWRLPTIAELQNLGSTNAGEWNLSTEYPNGLEMLANYAQLESFSELLEASQSTLSDWSQPDDFTAAFWSTDRSCHTYTVRLADGDAEDTHVCLQLAYDFSNGNTVELCPDINNKRDNCVEDARNPYYQNSHAVDGAGFLFVRSVPAGEGPYSAN